MRLIAPCALAAAITLAGCTDPAPRTPVPPLGAPTAAGPAAAGPTAAGPAAAGPATAGPADELPLGSALGDYLDGRFPGASEGYANHGEGPVAYVHVLPDGEHWLYVTSGASGESRSGAGSSLHEFVMRVYREPSGSGAWLDAPLWPAQVLCEIAAAEQRTGRAFQRFDRLRNMELPGLTLPYRHFFFELPDRALPELERRSGALHFVRVIPLTDEDLGIIESAGGREMMARWFDVDPLNRVPRR